MSLHIPKVILSEAGFGLNTVKSIEYLNDNLAITTEIWGKLKEPWAESGTIIAEEGYKWVTRWEVDKPYVVTKMYNAVANLVGIYCDISKPVTHTDGGFEFIDMYLDVWQTPGSSSVILDEDELAEALEAGYITKQEAEDAMQAAQSVVNLLTTEAKELEF